MAGGDAFWPSFLAALLYGGGYNTTLAQIGVTLLGAAAGVVGAFAMLRGRTLVADAVAHATLPGVALAFIAGGALGLEGKSLWTLLLGAAFSGLLGVAAIQAIVRYTRLGEDVAIAAVLSVFFGAGVVLLSHIQTDASKDQAGVATFIYGQTATLIEADAITIALVSALVVAAALIATKELRALAFDHDFARAVGMPSGFFDALLLLLLLALTLIGLKAVGALMVVALLAAPAAAARFWTERLGPMLALSAAFGALGCHVGVALSAAAPNAPAGGVIVLALGAIFVVSLFAAPARGLAAALLRRWIGAIEIAAQHVLRALFELIEQGAGGRGGGVALADLSRERPALRASLPYLRHWLRWRGLARVEDGVIRLTDKGRREALRVTRNHRLWEQFLVAYADLAPSHVDHSADLVEHALPADTVSELERRLAADGRLPRYVGAPPSVHPVDRIEGAAS